MVKNRITIILLTLSIIGCATDLSQYEKTDNYLYDKDFVAASEVIEEAKEDQYEEKDRVLYYLDLGMLYHYAGLYDMSNTALSEAEIAIEELYTQSVGRGIGSGFGNDNTLDYSGYAYEDVYINIFKALNYIGLNQNSEALVEIRRVHIKLNLLEDKYKEKVDSYYAEASQEESMAQPTLTQVNFYDDALARYLGAILFRYERSYDSARIDAQMMTQAVTSQPHLYPNSAPTEPIIFTEEGKVPLNIMAFTGLSPVKEAFTFYIDSGYNAVNFSPADSNANYTSDDILGYSSMSFSGITSDFHMKFEFPYMTRRGSSSDEVRIVIDGQRYQLALIEDIENIAEQTFMQELPLIIAKTITRAVVKGVAKEVGTEAASDAMESEWGAVGSVLGFLTGVVADVAVDATEQADLRISHYFPAHSYVQEITLEPGVYSIQVEYLNNGKVIYTDDKGEVDVSDPSLNFIESFLVDPR